MFIGGEGKEQHIYRHDPRTERALIFAGKGEADRDPGREQIAVGGFAGVQGQKIKGKGQKEINADVSRGVMSDGNRERGNRIERQGADGDQGIPGQPLQHTHQQDGDDHAVKQAEDAGVIKKHPAGGKREGLVLTAGQAVEGGENDRAGDADHRLVHPVQTVGVAVVKPVPVIVQMVVLKALVQILNLFRGVGMKNRPLIQSVEQTRCAEIKSHE